MGQRGRRSRYEMRYRGGISMVSEKVRAEYYNLNFGTNIIRNCNGTVIYRTREGKQKELFVLEKNLGELLLTIEIRNENGELLAKLRRNNFVYTKVVSKLKAFEWEENRQTFLLEEHDNKELAELSTYNVQVTVFFILITRIEATDEKLMIEQIHNRKCNEVWVRLCS
jgi:hypothetical protein